MKTFITIKVGYTTGMVGCTGEYFNTIIIDGNKITNIAHQGMYGSEERVNEALKNKGFKQIYIPSDFGKMMKKDLWKGFVSEYQAIEKIKTGEYKND